MWKIVFLTNLNLNIVNKFEKMYLYSPSLHQNLQTKLFKCFGNSMPMITIPITLNEKHLDITSDRRTMGENFEKSGTAIETYKSIEELKDPQE